MNWRINMKVYVLKELYFCDFEVSERMQIFKDFNRARAEFDGIVEIVKKEWDNDDDPREETYHGDYAYFSVWEDGHAIENSSEVELRAYEVK